MKNLTCHARRNCLLFVLFGFFLGCKSVDDLFTFTISNNCSITIASSSPVTLPFEIATPDVQTNSSEQFQNNNTNVNLVKDIRLNELMCTITSPQGETFNFLQSVKIFISTSSSDEIELAYLDSIPANATSITLIPTTDKLDSYVKASSYNLRTEAVTRETLTQNVNLNVYTKFKVTANL
jgi:hypothetical protein